MNDNYGMAKKNIDSFSKKVEEVISLVGQTFELLKDWRIEYVKLTDQLKRIFARNTCLRRKDFDNMMRVIESNFWKREEKLEKLLNKFEEQKREMVVKLRDSILSVNSETDISVVWQDILNSDRQVDKELAEVLYKYNLEQNMVSTGLRKLIIKGDEVRIKDFKIFVDIMETLQNQRSKLMVEFISDIGNVTEDIVRDWKDILHTLKICDRKVFEKGSIEHSLNK